MRFSSLCATKLLQKMIRKTPDIILGPNTTLKINALTTNFLSPVISLKPAISQIQISIIGEIVDIFKNTHTSSPTRES